MMVLGDRNRISQTTPRRIHSMKTLKMTQVICLAFLK